MLVLASSFVHEGTAWRYAEGCIKSPLPPPTGRPPALEVVIAHRALHQVAARRRRRRRCSRWRKCEHDGEVEDGADLCRCESVERLKV